MKYNETQKAGEHVLEQECPCNRVRRRKEEEEEEEAETGGTCEKGPIS